MPRTQGARTITHSRAICDRDKAWQSMRILRRFSLPDLAATAEIGTSNAGKYLRALLDADYLRVIKPKANGQKGGHALYMLIRNTGPHAPRLRTDGWVYDPNNGDIHTGGELQ